MTPVRHVDVRIAPYDDPMPPDHLSRPVAHRQVGADPAVSREFTVITRVAPMGVRAMGNWSPVTVLHGTCA